METTTRLIEVDGVLVCDDIRREDNGKLLIIGAYPTGINLTVLPGNILISALLMFRCIRGGDAKVTLEFRESWSDRKLGADIRLTVADNFDAAQPYQMASLTGMPFTVNEPGHLDVYYKYEDEDWQLIRTVPLTSLPSTEPSLPSLQSRFDPQPTADQP